MEKLATRIIELLEQEKPAFQLQSGTDELRSSEAHFTEGGRDTAAIKRVSYASSGKVLSFLAATVQPEDVTLETGGGWSTCVFGATARRHYCINPDLTANQLIRTFLLRHACLKADLHFLPHPSDQALPLLQKEIKVELAYIDGNHSFPIPIVDWHYIDGHLQKNGLLLVDDNQIRSVGLLTDFLSTEESYSFERMIRTTSIWKKILETRTWGWAAQRINHVTTDSVEKRRKNVKLGARLIRYIRGGR